MAVFNPRDKSRTSGGKTFNMVRQHTSPPKFDTGDVDVKLRWQWLTIEMMESPAFRTLSANALKCFFRVLIEHTAHAALQNGKLIIPHPQFIDYGVTGEYVADGLDELEYKGLIKIQRGRSGAGTAHPNIYTLTFVGNWEGAPATNEWKRCTMDRCRQWLEVDRKIAAEKRGKVGRKKKSPLRNPEIRSLRNSEIRRASRG
ncbi:hypothetical protein [Sinorhizobium fredii]|uniref:hypothetical protein n=1 Tax=Rhizobium fredii TaxID=380 RepID=UPI0004B090AE|nr:hypothetical protein [Sinorhizobium fredii]